MPTPTGYAPDGPPAIYQDAAPNADVAAGPQDFTPGTATTQKLTAPSSRKDSPVLSDGSTFNEIAAPTSKVIAHADYRTNVPV